MKHEYRVEFGPSVEKNLDKIPRKTRIRILDALEDLRKDPHPSGCKKLQGEDDLWRIRVGDYRVVYTVVEKKLIVLVVRVAHCKDVY
jgi:mRNA interferase RelE/StbE